MRGRKLLLVLTAAGLTLAVGTRLSGPLGRDAQGTPGEREGASGRAIPRAARTRTPAGPAPAATPSPAPVATAAPDARTRPVAGRQVLFPHGTPARSGDLPTVARRVLDENRDRLGLDRIPGELRLAREATTFSGHHLRFRQTIPGASGAAIPVEGSEVAVHLALDGRPILIHADVYPVRGAAAAPRISADAAVAAVRAFLADPDDADATFEHSAPELWVRPEGRDGRLVWRVDARTGDESARVAVDALDGEVVASRDLRVGVDGQAKVFQPNPVFSSHDTTLRDRSDRTSVGLAAAQQFVTVRRLDDSGFVSGQWCDATPTVRGDVFNVLRDWTALSRDDDAFELINAYVQIDATQERLQALGITHANAKRQRIDAHALAADQSYYDVSTETVRFGDGGVDDAEDGDIVVHEYGHAIQDDQVPGFGVNDEGGAMGEGFSDFLAASMHATGDAAWDPLVGSWDATAYSSANPPFLRRVDGSKVYPRDLAGEVHDDGEIWSAFLWDLRAVMGADDALRVAVGAHDFLASTAKFLQGANAVLAANESIRAGADDAAIRDRLRARGLPFSRPAPGAPTEDDREQNDDAAHAAPLAAGSSASLVLADEDWFQVTVAPFRRFEARATFESAEVDLELETRTTSGTLIDGSYSATGQETAGAVAGLDGATVLVRAFRAEGAYAASAYELAVLELDLESLRPGRTNLRRAAPGLPDAVTIAVGAEKVGGGAKLVVTSLNRPGGARNDVRIVSPSGTVVADFGIGATKHGARIVVPANETGAWRIELRSRDGTSGKYSLQAKFRK